MIFPAKLGSISDVRSFRWKGKVSWCVWLYGGKVRKVLLLVFAIRHSPWRFSFWLGSSLFSRLCLEIILIELTLTFYDNDKLVRYLYFKFCLRCNGSPGVLNNIAFCLSSQNT